MQKTNRSFGMGLLILGIVGIAAGLALGQNSGVLHKAILICFECIGIG